MRDSTSSRARDFNENHPKLKYCIARQMSTFYIPVAINPALTGCQPFYAIFYVKIRRYGIKTTETVKKIEFLG